ncbi:MAG: hypothetical protein FJ125_02570, partial [Deltaproteobacteria bacterium]|nr:hypothetical protein [Deltaproteobacteria bacterium]
MPPRFPWTSAPLTCRQEPDGRYLVRQGELQLRLGPLELQILGQLDGRTPLSELEGDLAFVAGRPLRPGTVERLVRRLAELGLVELPPPVELRWLPDDRTACCASGACCHLAVGPLDPLTARRLAALPWDEAGEPCPAGALLPVEQLVPEATDGAGEGSPAETAAAAAPEVAAAAAPEAAAAAAPETAAAAAPETAAAAAPETAAAAAPEVAP